MSTQILVVVQRRAQTVSPVQARRAKQSHRGQGCGKGTGQQPLPSAAGAEALGDVCCLTSCSTSSGSAGVPVRNELQNFEMLISQQSLASEPFPWGSYFGAIYS